MTTTTDDAILKSLIDMVGEDFASNRQEELYYYSYDMVTEGPRKVDYVAMPKTVEQVQRIVRMANHRKIPIVPMGAGQNLAGLTLPVRGGIVLDMKRMDRILEVNRWGRYAVMEAGVTQGALESYLEKNYPDLEHSRPECPAAATILGNLIIRGHGHLSLRHGNNADMINSMEVVLPTGEICQIGSSSVSPHWFCKGPLPELSGLFMGWHGTTGVVTKLSLKLYPKRRLIDVTGFVVRNLDLVPDVLYRITYTDIVENLFLYGIMPVEGGDWPQYITITITGDTEEEIEHKREVFRRVAKESSEGNSQFEFMEVVPGFFKERLVEKPSYVTAALTSDANRGGGFRYCAAILPVEKIPEAWERGIEIAHKHGMPFLSGVQLLGYCHSAMFGFVFTFNRADEKSIERVEAALDDANRLTLELGGLLWHPELRAQKQVVEKMDPNTYELINRIRKTLDPNDIMNPGNW
jgi:glycolate oxidase